MDRLIEQTLPTPNRRRVIAAWEALERAEALLPPDHPAMWHIERALEALAIQWSRREGEPTGTAAHH